MVMGIIVGVLCALIVLTIAEQISAFMNVEALEKKQNRIEKDFMLVNRKLEKVIGTQEEFLQSIVNELIEDGLAEKVRSTLNAHIESQGTDQLHDALLNLLDDDAQYAFRVEEKRAYLTVTYPYHKDYNPFYNSQIEEQERIEKTVARNLANLLLSYYPSFRISVNGFVIQTGEENVHSA